MIPGGLEPTPEEFDHLIQRTLEFVSGYGHEHRDILRTGDPTPADLEIREQPTDFDDLLGVVGQALHETLDCGHPGFVAYVTSSALPVAGLGSFITAALNPYPGVWAVAPGPVAVESEVIRWMCEVFGLPEAGFGLLLSGGSLANLTAIVTAREAILGSNPHRGVLYISEETHDSVVKAAHIAGIPPDGIRVLSTDERGRMDPEELDARIGLDRQSNLRPFCVVATAGTTSTGSVDPMDALADVCLRQQLWFHVDAAYGGFFRLCGEEHLPGIELADSITIDPHKGLFMPFGSGALLVREKDALRRAHAVRASSYLQDIDWDAAPVNFYEIGPELTREWRGLKLWLPLRLHGVDAFRSTLNTHLENARWLYDKLSRLPEYAVPFPPELSIVVWRHVDGDEATRKILNRINNSGEAYMSSTVVDGRLHLRACLIGHRTTRADVERILEICSEPIDSP